jgi:uncharacterized membrane protein YdjX (TVP38/TMEM64 family)
MTAASSRSRWILSCAALALVLATALVLWRLQPGLPDARWLGQRQAELKALHAAGPWAFAAGLFALFTLLSALALPGCSVLALAAGMAMGWLPGTLLVVLASTVGATLPFLAARHWWRAAVQRRWGHRLAAVQAGLTRDGAFYLFSLRVAPVIPYVLINPLMGLTAMPTRQFFGVSLLGMLAGSAAYVYAGTVLARAGALHALASPSMWAALLALAALPWLARWAWLRRSAGGAGRNA